MRSSVDDADQRHGESADLGVLSSAPGTRWSRLPAAMASAVRSTSSSGRKPRRTNHQPPARASTDRAGGDGQLNEEQRMEGAGRITDGLGDHDEDLPAVARGLIDRLPLGDLHPEAGPSLCVAPAVK